MEKNQIMARKSVPHRPYDHCEMINFSSFIYLFTRESRESNSRFIFIFFCILIIFFKYFVIYLFPFYFGCYYYDFFIFSFFFLTLHPAVHSPHPAPRPRVFVTPILSFVTSQNTPMILGVFQQPWPGVSLIH